MVPDDVARPWLAQYNLAVLRHPIGHPATRGFEDLIDETNRHADTSPGFVWRHGIDTREVDDLPYDDKLVTVNASVWESAEALRAFAYRGFHRDVYRRRREWFERAAAVMWWVPRGTIPSLQECMARMDFYAEFGSTPYAFTTADRLPTLVMRRHHPTQPADGAVFGAWLAEEPRAIGAWHRIDTGTSPPRIGEVTQWWCTPSARGGRLGAAVLAAVASAARDQGVTELRLTADGGHPAARGLAQRFGFVACGPQGEDTEAAGPIGMAKPLGPIRTWRPPRRS